MEHIHTFDSRRVAVLPLQKVSLFHFKMKEFHYVNFEVDWFRARTCSKPCSKQQCCLLAMCTAKEVINHLPIISNSPPSRPRAWLNLLMWAAINTRWASQPYGHRLFQSRPLANPYGSMVPITWSKEALSPPKQFCLFQRPSGNTMLEKFQIPFLGRHNGIEFFS